MCAAPLPEVVWENLDSIAMEDLPLRTMTPRVTAIGTGFLEYFLPLMTILGDILEIHHRRRHPRFGNQDDSVCVGAAEKLLKEYEASLEGFSGGSPGTSRHLANRKKPSTAY